MKTFIDLYDMNKKKLITIYKHSERVQVLGCSVNEERTLIGSYCRFYFHLQIPNPLSFHY
jgi:hypothetical protein